MKQILLTLFLTFSLCINAQIQRMFFGLELSKASKQQVEKKMKEKGYEVRNDFSETLSVYDVTFGDRTWRSVNFRFYDDKLYSISFYRTTKAINGSDETQEFFGSISNILKEKYPDKIVIEEPEKINFDDEKTHISLISGKNRDFNTKYVVLGYSDRKLMSEKTKAAISEF